MRKFVKRFLSIFRRREEETPLLKMIKSGELTRARTKFEMMRVFGEMEQCHPRPVIGGWTMIGTNGTEDVWTNGKRVIKYTMN